MKHKTLALFVGCFVLPVVLAVSALHFNWVPQTTTNYGQLLNKEVRLANWQRYSQAKWTLVLDAKSPCGHACEAQLKAMQAIRLALGKKSQGVNLMLLSDAPASLPQWQAANLLEEVTVKPYQEQDEAQLANLNAGDLLLVDHMGLAVLHYPYTSGQEQQVLVHKGVMKDIKKLLNYARTQG